MAEPGHAPGALSCERTAGGVAVLAFDRPAALNAIDAATFADLGRLLAAFAGDRGVRAVVLRGRSAVFSAGADIKEPVPSAQELLSAPVAGHPARLLYRMPQPTLAAIRSYCLGGGLELALAADLRIAAEDAVFGFAEVDWGLTTGWGGAVLLERLVGRGRALDLVLTGRRFGAEEALRLGLVGEVVPTESFEARVAEAAASLAAKPAGAVAAFKQILSDPAFEAGLAREIEAFAEVAHSEEAVRLLEAFGRKTRKP